MGWIIDDINFFKTAIKSQRTEEIESTSSTCSWNKIPAILILILTDILHMKLSLFFPQHDSIAMQCNSAQWIIHIFYKQQRNRNKAADKKFEGTIKKTDSSAHEFCEAVVHVNVCLHCETLRLQRTRREVIKIKLMECCCSWESQGLMTGPDLTLTLNVQKSIKKTPQKTNANKNHFYFSSRTKWKRGAVGRLSQLSRRAQETCIYIC